MKIDIDKVPIEIKSNVYRAYRWAKKTLTYAEGHGHHIVLSRKYNNHKLICCSFAKPEWPGDHSGSYQETAAMAIVISVIEYLNFGE